MAAPKFIQYPFAATGDKMEIPNTAQESGSISYAEGFGLDYELNPETNAKAKRVPREGMNQVLFDATSNIQQYQQYGVPYWYDATSNGGTSVAYQKNSMIRYNDGASENVYISLKDNNTDTPTVETSWFLFAPYDATLLSDLSVAPFVPVESMTLITPPSIPIQGKAYLIPANATGVWANRNGQLAEWNGKKWTFASTNEGHSIGLNDGRLFTKINGIYVGKIALDSQSGKWNYAIVTGTANTLTATLNPAPMSLTIGMTIHLKINAANTGETTFNLNGFGAKPIIYHETGEQLIGGDLQEGDVIELIYDGANWRLQPSLIYMAKRTLNNKNSIRADRIEIFSIPGTYEWIIPDNVDFVDVDIWGAGGGGGGSYGAISAAGGGGGGAFARIVSHPCKSGDKIMITIGKGGAGGGGEPKNGTSGGASSFGNILTIGGGTGGLAAYQTTSSGSLGGLISGTAHITVNGGEGGMGSTTSGYIVGGSGGYSYAGSCTPLVPAGAGWGGISTGCGGGGGSAGNRGGQGSNGKVILRY